MPVGSVDHPPGGSTWRHRTASGALVTAMSLGLRRMLDQRFDDEAVVVDATSERPEPNAVLELYFDASGPTQTWVLVRPWLVRARR